MSEILLFTDGSVNVQTKIGFGACLAIHNFDMPVEEAKTLVKTHRFDNTSSTKLELETLLWALSEIPSGTNKITVYTDSQNIANLPRRRRKLEQNNYQSKNGRSMNNHELYQKFYQMMDALNCDLVKVTGHQPSRQKDKIHRLFALVDKASRKALRNSYY